MLQRLMLTCWGFCCRQMTERKTCNRCGQEGGSEGAGGAWEERRLDLEVLLQLCNLSSKDF